MSLHWGLKHNRVNKIQSVNEEKRHHTRIEAGSLLQSDWWAALSHLSHDTWWFPCFVTLLPFFVLSLVSWMSCYGGVMLKSVERRHSFMVLQRHLSQPPCLPLPQWWTKDSVSPSTTDGSRRTAATSGSSPAPPSPLMPRMPVRRTSFGSTTSSGWWSQSLHLSCIENARIKASLGQKMIERSFYFQCKVKQG